jgi:exoribonuclease-2
LAVSNFWMLGKFIEYIEQGDLICTICLQDRGTKLHLLTLSNREVNLSPKRALLVSGVSLDTDKSREELLDRLRKTEENREKLKSMVDVKELWELIKDEKEQFDYRYLAQLSFGEDVTDEHLSGLVRALFEDRLYFRMKDGHFFPNTEDRVEQIIKQREEERRREEWLTKGALWLKDLKDGKTHEPPSFKADIVRLLMDLILYETEAPEFKFGKELLARAGIGDLKQARALLVKMGVWDEDENLDLIRFHIAVLFSETSLAESARVAFAAKSFEGREDLTHLSVLTIDGPYTRDFDDGLSLEWDGESLQLGIHIADVAGAILPGTDLDADASARASSLYLPRRRISMLPETLSEEALSLKAGLDREAVSLLARVDLQGRLLEYRFVTSVIRVRENLAYNQVDSAIDQDETLKSLWAIVQKFRERRTEQGAVNISMPELVVKFDADGSLSLMLVPQNTPSRIIVAELMIFYNWLAATLCTDHQIPLLFRTQAQPSERFTVDEHGYLYYAFRQRRKLNPLHIETKPKPHSVCGLNVYTQCTSPIRRYLDLVVQRQIKGFITEGNPPYDEKGLEAIRLATEPTLRQLERIRRKRIRYWVLKYLKENTHKQFDAMVLNELRNRYEILLPDFLLLADLKRRDDFSLFPGQSFLVEVKRADPWEDLLELAYAGTK